MSIARRLRDLAAQYEADRSAPLADAAGLMREAAREIDTLERQYQACRGANEGLHKAMWEARDLLAEIDADLDRQLHE